MPRMMRRMARTAAVAGTAAHVAGKHQAQQDAAAAAAQQPTPAPAAPEPQAAAPVGMTDDAMSQLEKLAELKAQGILTEEEFAEQKAKILAG